MANRKSLLVPEARAALEQMKYEIAQELGIQLPADGYYGHMTTYDMGSIGGSITKRLVQIAQEQMAGRF
ncbi:alpha/beta-type small acid-soluble spore protein [Paenibacillus glycanilyticus]|uniref:Acid-soluble spore protein n=1 Tax=Paenibacillus glycanilyticus TaxID=126569 RepID=A0ABQ6GFB7_9BACL|nr:alpha/beta-type small acid-soluble spore protein [Paenibacillus glycanilyticus]GLX69372.1 acid-soluble spore protein [Paenibacillus glycanilyticus]